MRFSFMLLIYKCSDIFQFTSKARKSRVFALLDFNILRNP